MSAAAGRPLNWNVMRVTMDTLEEVHAVLRAGASARRQGGEVVALTMPIPSRPGSPSVPDSSSTCSRGGTA